jgi:hypothetical protein
MALLSAKHGIDGLEYYNLDTLIPGLLKIGRFKGK